MSYRAYYHDRKQRGKCVECASRDAVAGKTMCAPCLAERRERKSTLVGLGVCTNCGSQPAEPRRKKCARCLRDCRDAIRALFDRRRDAGQCVTCGRDPTPGRKSCDECRRDQARRSRESYHARRVCRDEIDARARARTRARARRDGSDA